MTASLIAKSTDASAPQLISGVGTFVTFLKTVLVDGYGTFPGFGWTRPFVSGDGYTAVFRNDPDDGTGHYYRFYNDTGTLGDVFPTGFEQMSSVDAGILPIHELNYAYPWRFNYGPSSVESPHPWMVIGDNQGVWIFCKSWDHSTAAGHTSWRWMFIGDYSPFDTLNKWNSCLLCFNGNAGSGIGGNNGAGFISYSSTGSINHLVTRQSDLHFGSARGNLRIGMQCDGSYIGQVPEASYYSRVEDAVQLAVPVYISSPTGLLGMMPGCLSPLQLVGLNGLNVTVDLESSKAYRTYTYSDHIRHYFPYITNSVGYVQYICITSGEGFRNVLF